MSGATFWLVRLQRVSFGLFVCALAAPIAGQDQRPQRRGRVTAILTGAVLSEHEKPIPNARVTAHRLRFVVGGEPYLESRAAVGTNELGEYRITDLPPGDYFVSAVGRPDEPPASLVRPATDGRPRGYGLTFYPGTTTLAQAGRISLGAGDVVTGIDVPLVAGTLARISGTVVSGRGALLDVTPVTLAPAAALGFGALEGFVSVTQPIRDGRFSIDRVPPGEYTLVARSVSARVARQVAGTGSSTPLRNDLEFEQAVMPLQVSGDDINGLALELRQPGTIRGAVMIESAAASLEAHGLFASVIGLSGGSPGGRAALEVVGRDGRFETRGSGRFILRLESASSSLSLARVERDGIDVTDTGFVVEPGEVVSNVRMIATAEPTELAGWVSTKRGRVAEPCMVVVFTEDSNRWWWPATRYVQGVATRDGQFAVRGLPPGKYLATAVSNVSNDEWKDPSFLLKISSKATRITLRARERRTLDLQLADP